MQKEAYVADLQLRHQLNYQEYVDHITDAKQLAALAKPNTKTTASLLRHPDGSEMTAKETINKLADEHILAEFSTITQILQ